MIHYQNKPSVQDPQSWDICDKKLVRYSDYNSPGEKYIYKLNPGLTLVIFIFFLCAKNLGSQ